MKPQRTLPTGLAVVLAVTVACAHTSPPAAPTPGRVWPAPPARALVRYFGSFPDGRSVPDQPPWWKRILTAIVGTEPERQAGSLLERPFGLAATEGGFAVADPDGRKVLRVDAALGRATAVECEGLDWKMPLAVAAAPDGSLYVADGGAGAIVHVDGHGACVKIGAGALERPAGLAMIAGRIYVIDPPRHQVVAFAPDGRELLRFGGRGDTNGQLNFPTGIANGGDDTLLVVDALNFRVVRYSAAGSYLESFGEPGDGEGAFGRPKGVAVDGLQRIYVTDAQHDVVIAFSRQGAFVAAIGSGAGSLTLPAGLAIGGGFLYVADPYNHRVQIFQLLAEDAP